MITLLFYAGDEKEKTWINHPCEYQLLKELFFIYLPKNQYVMIIQKISQLSHLPHSMDIPVDRDKYYQWLYDQNPSHIQDYFPELTDEQREFILTGITPEEWEMYIPEYD